MSRRLISILFLLCLTAGLALALVRQSRVAPPAFAPAEYAIAPAPEGEPLFSQGFVFGQAASASVHSGTLAPTGDGGLLAAWFGGTREGAGDVAIYGANWSGDRWGEPWVLADRPRTEQALGLHLRKLGNPVLHRAPDGRLWLFYVVVSIGGWSTSAIALQTSDDDGRHWSPARRLVSSPFLNISTLVRARPLDYADGSLALPAYHELVGKFGELLRLDAVGRVLGKQRISSGRGSIQPTLVASGPNEAQAWLRRVGDSPRRVLWARSQDAGVSWSKVETTDLPNPDASVAALGTARGDYLLAYNPSPRERSALALALSPDGRHWRPIATLAQGSDGEEYSYPFLVRAAGGDYHLIYTWRRTRMAHVRFNEAWLESRR
jgi:predicted neuraminidase